jgi:hypothetical protein
MKHSESPQAEQAGGDFLKMTVTDYQIPALKMMTSKTKSTSAKAAARPAPCPIPNPPTGKLTIITTVNWFVMHDHLVSLCLVECMDSTIAHSVQESAPVQS